jgi:hypothetical protein
VFTAVEEFVVISDFAQTFRSVADLEFKLTRFISTSNHASSRKILSVAILGDGHLAAAGVSS